MEITLLKAKIHRAVVTQADLDYVGSITIDSRLLHEAGILEYEKVEMTHKPTVLFVDDNNQIVRKANY